MKSKFLQLPLILFFLFAVSNAYAGIEVGNGGDSLVFDFVNAAHAAVFKIEANKDFYEKIKIASLTTQLAKTRVIVSDDPLFVTVDGVKQQSVAINYHDPDRIVVHRSSWLAIQDTSKKEALALHEYLSLLGFEDSGHYDISKNLTADCYGPQLARDSVRAITLVSNRANITDLLGGCTGNTCEIVANYRQNNYADIYQVSYDQIHCRIISLTLVSSSVPVQNPH